MSDHSEACQECKTLCDELYDHLSKRIPNLERVQTIRWCAVYQSERTRFAYICHRKKMSRIEVWCLGDLLELQRNTPLKIIPRKETRGGWGEGFQARFFLTDSSQIDYACDLMYQVSYRLSKEKRHHTLQR